MSKFNIIENLPNDLIYYILDLSLLKNINKFFLNLINKFVFKNHSDICLTDKSDPYFNKHINITPTPSSMRTGHHHHLIRCFQPRYWRHKA